MSAPKKIKLTDHFRAALKPRDLNLKSNVLLKQQPQPLQQQQPKQAILQPQQPAQPQQQQLKPLQLKPQLADLRYQEPASIYWEPHYASESFEYDRLQEVKYNAQYKLHSKVDLVDLQNDNYEAPRRAELVDWLVDIQMRFSLDHEPLYMAVKLADHYLARKFVSQDQHVLLFLTSILISAKYDERVPPITISDLIHLSRSKFGVRYNRKQVISFEVDLLNTLNFDIRFPLSYGFLRRFARCMRSDMRTIHLARYILESSLLDFDNIEILDSKLAAGCLLLAFEMLNQTGAWDESARYHTGYNEKDLYPLVTRLNRILVKFSRKRTAIRRKYIHESFMEVARIPILPKYK